MYNKKTFKKTIDLKKINREAKITQITLKILYHLCFLI